MKPTLTSSLRYLQISLGLCSCFYFLLVAVNNCLDYQSNFAFVRHVMAMDTIFPTNNLKYRAIDNNFVHNFVYLSIIVWEAAVALVMGWGTLRLVKNIHQPANIFQSSKSLLILGFNLSIVLWFYGFIIVGSEWFLMWQSKEWNGRTTAFDVLLVNLLALIVVLIADNEGTSNGQ